MARSLAVVSLSDVRLSGDGVGGSSRLGARGAMTGHGLLILALREVRMPDDLQIVNNLD